MVPFWLTLLVHCECEFLTGENIEKMITNDLRSSSPLSLTNSSFGYDLVNPTTTTTISTLPSKENLSFQISEILELDDSTDSEIIVKQLQIKGRQALINEKSRIAEVVYLEQMMEKSDLLNLLKQYFEQEWYQSVTDDETWFKEYLKQQKLDSTALYDEILTRTAEYGITYLKDNTILSLVIQFIFEFDDEDGTIYEKFDDIWRTLTTSGRQNLKKYEDQLSTATVEEQLRDASPLYLALQQYYRQPLKDLLKQSKISDRRNTVDTALQCVVNNGWWQGLHNSNFTRLIAKVKFDFLITHLKQYLNENNLPVPVTGDEVSTVAAAFGSSSVSSTITAEMLTPPSSQTTDDLSLSQVSSTTDVCSMPSTLSSQDSNTILIARIALPSSSLSTTISNNITTENFSSPPASPPSNTFNFFTQQETVSEIGEQNRIAAAADQERRSILSCVMNSDAAKLNLSQLVQAGELMYIGKKRDEILSVIVTHFRQTNNFPLFVDECLIPIMYLIKRYQNLDDFIEALSSKLSRVFLSVTELPKISLRMLIHFLLMKCDISLSRMIMTLLSKRNPVPFLNPSTTSQYSIVPEIIHVWNYEMPTLLSFGIGQCSGKSTLLNALFMSTFEESSSSIYFQQTIDIDFGYGFLRTSPRHLNIADTHGRMTKQLLCKIHELFDGFLLHVDYSYLLKNTETVLDFSDTLTSRKFRLLLIRDSPSSQLNQNDSLVLTRVSSRIQTFMLPSIANQNKQSKQLIRTLSEIILGKQTFPSPTSDKDFIKSELNRLINDNNYKEHLTEIDRTITPLKLKLLHLVRNENYVTEYYPEYSNFVELCKLQQKLVKLNFYGEDDAVIYQVRQGIIKLKARQNSVKDGGIIFDLFVKILKAPNALMCLNLLAAQLKEERDRFISTGEMAKQLPIERNLSLEVLWRNAIVCSRYQPSDVEEIIIQRYLQSVEAGLPFEIIDGDNYHFPYVFLTKVLSSEMASYFANKTVLIISVLGPQNSGKSTLLNYMFGTFFDVRDGRCTRGIYGSFMKSNRREFDYILLIDTEGLFGVEREDKEFDRRLVLFCLAVSHLVIVNMIGEVNESLKTMLTLCADSLKEMGVNRVPQPIVHFVLNQKADLNIQNHKAAIDKIITDLKAFDLSGMIDIKPETFHTLPNAFKKERGSLNDISLPYLIKTEPDFVELVQLLTGKIIDSATECLSRSSDQFTDPIHWLESSITIFNTLQKFADLTYYRDINERRQDNEVREYISTKLHQEFSSKYCDQLTSQSASKKEREIEDLLLPEIQKKQDELNDELENRLKLLKTSDTIRTRSRQFLKVQIIEMFNALRTQCKIVSERAQIQLLVQNGEGELNKLINEITARDCLPDYQNYILDHLAWLQTVRNSKHDEKHILEDLHSRFTALAYKYPVIHEHTFIPDSMNPYSTDTVDSLVHLNKQLLKQRFTEFLHVNSVTESEPKQAKNKSTPRRVWNAIMKWNSTSAEATTNEQNTESRYIQASECFLLLTRQEIDSEWKKPRDRSKIREEEHLHVQASKLIGSVIRLVVDATHTNGNGNTSSLNEPRQIHTDLIQKIVGAINTLIKDINLELSPFCLTLNKQLKSTFHTCAIILLTKYYFNEQQRHFLQTLSTLDDRKQELRSHFISMVVPNTSNDDGCAISLCKQVKEYILKALLEDGRKRIKFDLQQYDDLNRKAIQDKCDGRIITAEKQWCLEYIENPTKIIVEYFNNMWVEIEHSINQNLMHLKAQHTETLANFFHCMQGNYRLTSDAQQTFNLLAQQYKPSEKLQAVTKAMATIYDTCSIATLSAFLERITQESSKILKQFQVQNCDFTTIDTEETYARLLDKIRGCPNCCPCCGRPCDHDHAKIKSNPGSEENKHRCATGHALRAMNGYKFEETEEASLFMCEQITDDQYIIVGSLRKKWSQFKLDHPDWIFESLLNNDELSRLHEKFLTVWAKIGEDLCRKYDMKFVTFNTYRQRQRPQSLHYVLLLDASGSMYGKPWQDLLAAVKEFLRRRQDLVGVQDHITIITFSDKAHLAYFDKEIKDVNVDTVQFGGNTTDFCAAFTQVYQCIQNSRRVDLDLKYAIIFMTDGDAIYPEQELNLLSAAHGVVIKQFWTLALGHAKMNVLNRINEKMNGTYFDIEESSRLIDAYAEIARTS
ncbi:unnamed protein product [Didymodactylos carnosus]|uniref:VLIG-type G domain-containing protein n=1 Tax=Didymodactylos carnosus TaxID=1234261 RepID=A0A8S2N1U1_9BILA|nr:unnamed protein product [Didymodactylos carnosus]